MVRSPAGAINAPVERYGFGRVDAFGHIFDRVFSTAIDAPDNDAKADAPVSSTVPLGYAEPDARARAVELVGPNAGLGDVARNVGELLGVFWRIRSGEKACGGTVLPEVVSRCEETGAAGAAAYNATLPVWPSGLSQEMKIDPEAAARGKTVYESNCQRCHALIDRAAANRKAHDKSLRSKRSARTAG